MYIYILGLGTIADIFTITVEPLATAMLLASRDYCDICTCFCTCAVHTTCANMMKIIKRLLTKYGKSR